MRNRCGEPSRSGAERRVECCAEPLFVRAFSVVPSEPVLKIAHGAALRSVPKPTCWNDSLANVATNSSDAPGVYVAVVPTSVPLTVSRPATDRRGTARVHGVARPAAPAARSRELGADRGRELDLTVAGVRDHRARRPRCRPQKSAAVVSRRDERRHGERRRRRRAAPATSALLPARSVDVTR